MNRAIPILAGVVAIAALTFFCVRSVKGPIELDLSGRAALALRDAGVEGVLVGANGRALTLRGTIADASTGAKARQTVAALWGVEVVEDAMVLAAAPPKVDLAGTEAGSDLVEATAPGPDDPDDPVTNPGLDALALADLPPIVDNDLEVRVVRDGEQVALVGGAPDAETKARWLAAAVAAYGDDGVRDALTVEGKTPSPTLDAGVLAVIPWVGPLDEGLGVASCHGLSLSGRSKAPGTTTAVRNAWMALPQNYDLRIDIEIPGETARHRCQMAVDALLLKDPIRFQEDDPAKLTKRSRRVVRDVAKALDRCKDADVFVEAHTDDTDTTVENLALSQDRADAVVARLARGGVKKRRLVADGVGEAQPLTTNKTKAGRALNERIEIRVERTGMR